MSKKQLTIHWTLPARENLLEMVAYVKMESAQAAIHLAEKIKEKVSRLSKFPYSGRLVPEFPNANLREVITGNYRIIYRVRTTKGKEQIEILTVHHTFQILE